MAKSIRSKAKRHFRNVRREIVSKTEWAQEDEARREAAMEAALAAPTLTDKLRAEGKLEEAMETAAPAPQAAKADAMEADGAPLPPTARASSNPDKLLNRLKKTRPAKKHRKKQNGERRRRRK